MVKPLWALFGVPKTGRRGAERRPRAARRASEEEDRLKTKRWWLSAGSALAVAALAAACGSSSSNSSSSAASTSGGAAPAASSASTAAPAIKVGLVTDVGGLDDKSFNFLANKGLEKAKADLGVQTAVKQSKAPTDYVPNLQGFAAQGYNLVIGVGFSMGDAVGKVAKANPNTKFAIVDFSATDKATINGAPNAAGLLFKEQEAGYLVGVLAGTLQKMGGVKGFNTKNVISSVGGVKIPPVDHYIAGYQAGAKAADPGIKTLNGYSQDFVKQDLCQGVAKSQISQGSDVVFQVAGGCGLGALDAAKAAGVWGIGVDADQSYLGPHILASAVKRVDVAVESIVKAVQDGSFKGGADVIFDLKGDGVGIEGINAVAPQSAKDAVDKAIADIKSGAVTVPDTVP
jgi:basic membrane protein A